MALGKHRSWVSITSIYRNVVGIRSAIQDVGRLRQILTILSKHGFGVLVSRLKLTETIGFRTLMRYGDAEQPVYTLPRRLRVVLEELGPAFIKLGQILSTRSDILGHEITDELQSLQDDVPPMSWEDVQQQIQEATGLPISDTFSEFSEEPLACASIAQVHKATLFDGTQVVVKVQRRAIRGTIDSDLSILYFLAERAADFVPELELLDPVGVVKEFDRAIHHELDFSYERRSMQRFQHNFRGVAGIGIPAVYADACSGTMLTMEFIDGVKITEAPKILGADSLLLSRIMLRALFKMMFQDGLFHGDLHPGNILVRRSPGGAETGDSSRTKDGAADDVGHRSEARGPKSKSNDKFSDGFSAVFGEDLGDEFAAEDSGAGRPLAEEPSPWQIVLLDFGLTGRLLPRHRDNIIDLLVSIGREDYEAIARIFFDLGVKQPGVRYDFAAFETDVIEVVERHLAGRTLNEIELQEVVGDLISGAIKHSIKMPPTYTLVFKALMTVEGIGKTMSPELNVIDEAKPFAREILLQRYNPERLIREGLDTLVGSSTVFRNLAQSTPRLLRDLEMGRITLQVESDRVADNLLELKKTGQRLYRAVLSSAAVVCGTLALEAEGPVVLGLPALSFGAFVVAGLVALPLVFPLLGRD